MGDSREQLEGFVAAADEALRGTPAPHADRAGRVDLVAESPGGDVWHRIDLDGAAVAGWRLLDAPPDDADALRQPLDVQLRALAHPGGADGNDVLAASWIEERRGGKVVRRVPPAPRITLEEGHWRHLLPVPHASFTAQHVLEATPFGRITFHRTVTDGVETASGFGTIAEPELVIVQRYVRLMGLLYARDDVLDSFEGGGRAEGNWTKLMTLGGLATSPEAEEQDGRGSAAGGFALGVLGELMATPAWTQLTGSLAVSGERT